VVFRDGGGMVSWGDATTRVTEMGKVGAQVAEMLISSEMESWKCS